MTYHVAIPCAPQIHEDAQQFLSAVERGNAKKQSQQLAQLASQFYTIVINDYAGTQFSLANANNSLTQTALNIFTSTTNQLIKFIVPKLKEHDIIALGQYVSERMLIIDGKTYAGWPAMDGTFEKLSFLKENTSTEVYTPKKEAEIKQIYVDYQCAASLQISDVLYQPAELIRLGRIAKTLVKTAKSTTQKASLNIIKRVSAKGTREQLISIVDFQLAHLKNC